MFTIMHTESAHWLSKTKSTNDMIRSFHNNITNLRTINSTGQPWRASTRLSRHHQCQSGHHLLIFSSLITRFKCILLALQKHNNNNNNKLGLWPSSEDNRTEPIQDSPEKSTVTVIGLATFY